MTVSVLGCGWFGLPLSIKLIENGYTLKGSTTSPDKLVQLEKNGIQPYLINISADKSYVSGSDFFQTDVLVLNIPPGRKKDNVEHSYIKICNEIIEQLNSNEIKHVVFISSTSVYPANNKTVTEHDTMPETPSGKALLKAEELFFQHNNFSTTVLRFGGLIGYERNSASLLKKKKTIVNASAPLNLIHRDDCIAITLRIISGNFWGYVFNACSDFHPLRKDFYLKAAQDNNIHNIDLIDAPNSYKIVSSELLKNTLNYNFKYPNPLTID